MRVTGGMLKEFLGRARGFWLCALCVLVVGLYGVSFGGGGGGVGDDENRPEAVFEDEASGGSEGAGGFSSAPTEEAAEPVPMVEPESVLVPEPAHEPATDWGDGRYLEVASWG